MALNNFKCSCLTPLPLNG